MDSSVFSTIKSRVPCRTSDLLSPICSPVDSQQILCAQFQLNVNRTPYAELSQLRFLVSRPLDNGSFVCHNRSCHNQCRLCSLRWKELEHLNTVRRPRCRSLLSAAGISIILPMKSLLCT